MTLNQHTLPNGLRIVHAPSATPVAYGGFAIDAGTRDEDEREQGMAHFVEHLIFKGTRKRRAWHILNRMERVGGDLNAFTNKEETVIYSAFLAADFARAAELLTDITFHSTFPPQEIGKEVEVILDEIQSYEDSPSELIFDEFENLLFQGHPLGRNILGEPALLKGFRSADALSWTGRFYAPRNMVFFLRGNADFRRVVRLVEKLTADIPAGSANRRTRPLPPYVPQSVTKRRDTHQAHVMLGRRSYDAHDERRTALYLLNNILGGPGMNSRLNVALRERRGLVYNVESNLTSYTDTGVMSIYFGCDLRDVDTCLRLVHKELRRLRDVRLTDTRLAAAKKQLTGQIAVAGDNFENLALDMGKTFLHYGLYESREEVFARINAVTASQLLEVANEMLDESGLTTLVYR